MLTACDPEAGDTGTRKLDTPVPEETGYTTTTGTVATTYDTGVPPGWYTDDDGDGYSEAEGDCHDGDPSVNPGAYEDFGDRVDNDCDGAVDWPGEQPGVAVDPQEYRVAVVDGLFLSGSYRYEWVGYNGQSLCAYIATLVEDGLPLDGCPDCEWAFSLSAVDWREEGEWCKSSENPYPLENFTDGHFDRMGIGFSRDGESPSTGDPFYEAIWSADGGTWGIRRSNTADQTRVYFYGDETYWFRGPYNWAYYTP